MVVETCCKHIDTHGDGCLQLPPDIDTTQVQYMSESYQHHKYSGLFATLVSPSTSAFVIVEALVGQGIRGVTIASTGKHQVGSLQTRKQLFAWSWFVIASQLQATMQKDSDKTERETIICQ